jgi:hypothetical protein
MASGEYRGLVMLRMGLRVAAALAVSLSLVGCSAEWKNHGGLIDKIEDKILFKADTKSHRLIRSFLMVSALTSISRYSGIPEPDLGALSGRIDTSLNIVNEAYECLSIAATTKLDCVFFDEMMARLDYNVYKLAVLVLLDAKNRELLADARDRLVGDIPVLGPALKSATRAVQAVEEAATATQHVTQIIDGLFRLGELSVRTGGKLLPLYRDAIEMDMVIVVDHLATFCATSFKPALAASPRRTLYDTVLKATVRTSECAQFVQAFDIYWEGDGELQAWRDYLKALNGTLRYIQAKPVHFSIVARHLFAGCNATFRADAHIKNCEEKVKTWYVVPKVVATTPPPAGQTNLSTRVNQVAAR